MTEKQQATLSCQGDLSGGLVVFKADSGGGLEKAVRSSRAGNPEARALG